MARWGASILLAIVAMVWTSPVPAQPLMRPTRASRDEAIRAIPYNELDADGQAKVSAVLSNVTLYRRLPTQTVRCSRDLYLFMVQHPDVTVNIWQVLGITSMTLDRTGPTTFRANDGNGAKGDVEFLYTSDDTQLVYTVGTYEGPLFQKPVRGGCLLLLKSSYGEDDKGTSRVTSQLDLFFNVEHLGVEIFTKTFQPLVGKAADYNFIESNNFLASLFKTGETRPASMQQLAGRLTNINPDDRQQFAMLMASIPQTAARPTVVSRADVAPPSRAAMPGPGMRR